MNANIKNADGKLGVLVVGLNGAVSTTFITGTIAVAQGKGEPVGSLTQMGTIRIGKRTENKFPKIQEDLSLLRESSLFCSDEYIDKIGLKKI